MVAFPPLTRPLTDGPTTLRPFAERDIPEVLIAYEADPTLHVRLGEERPPSAADLGRAAERAPTRWANGAGLTLSILADGSERSGGELRVHHVQSEPAHCELGLWVAPALRGRGHATRALRLGARWLLEECGLRRVAVLTEADNAAMRATAVAAGFQLEGVLRGYTRERGRRVDHAVLSRIAGDP